MNLLALFDQQLWISTLAMATPLILAALGGTFSERTGVVNIAMEGMMLLGAFVAVAASALFHSAWLGLLAAVAAGAVLALLFAWAAVTFRSDQVVVGMAVNILAAGITAYLLNSLYGSDGTPVNTPRLPNLTIPGLVHLPVVGPILGSANVMEYVALAGVVASHWLLFKTPLGLRMRAVGEKPEAADVAGIHVQRLRYLGVVLSGLLSAAAGAYLSIGVLNRFDVNMSGGRGYIALAAMIFGGWTPFGSFLASLLFGFATALAMNVQTIQSFGVSHNLVLMLPYALTILAVAGLVGRTTPPAADGVPYEPSH